MSPRAALAVVVAVLACPASTSVAGNFQEPARVIFASERIYSVNSDGTGLVKLTSEAVYEGNYAVSRDGSSIAYQRGASEEIVVMGADGAHPRPTGLRAVDLDGWSADGRLLYNDWNTEREWLFDVAKSRVAGSVGPPGCCDAVGLSPSGDDFAGVVFEPAGARGIVIVDLPSRKWRWLYRGSVGFADPVWSPDGKSVAFTLSASDIGPDAQPLAVASVRTGKLTRLARVGPELDVSAVLAWAPGPRLVFSRIVGKDRSALFSWDGARTTAIPLAGSARDPRWSPDGTMLAFRWSRFASTYDEGDFAVLRDGRARRITPLGVNGDFTFVGWSQGPRLREAAPLTAVAMRPEATLRVERAGPLETGGGRVGISGPCGPLVLWEVRGGARRTVPTGCEDIHGEVAGLALTRATAAWVFRWVDRNEGQDCLMLADAATGDRASGGLPCGGYVSKSKAYRIYRDGAVEAIVGGGDSIAYSARSAGGVFVVEATAPRKAIAGAVLLAYDGSRFVVRRGSAAEIVGAAGHVTRLAGVMPVEARLRGNTLVTIDVDGALRVRDARTGSATRTVHLTPRPVDRARLEDAAPPYAAVVADGQLRMVRLADGRSVPVALPNSVAPIHARFLGGRVAISFNALGISPYGRAVLMPLSAVASVFRRA